MGLEASKGKGEMQLNYSLKNGKKATNVGESKYDCQYQCGRETEAVFFGEPQDAGGYGSETLRNGS